MAHILFLCSTVHSLHLGILHVKKTFVISLLPTCQDIEAHVHARDHLNELLPDLQQKG